MNILYSCIIIQRFVLGNTHTAVSHTRKRAATNTLYMPHAIDASYQIQQQYHKPMRACARSWKYKSKDRASNCYYSFEYRIKSRRSALRDDLPRSIQLLSKINYCSTEARFLKGTVPTTNTFESGFTSRYN